MEAKIDPRQWEGRKDLKRRSKDIYDNASHRFQRLVDVALEDGYISNAEAHMLVQEHNKMQEVSRVALKKILKEHGYDNLANRGVPRSYMPERMYSNPSVSNSNAYGREGHNPENYSQWTDAAREVVDGIFLDDSDAIRFVEKVGDVAKRPGKKVTFFLIIALPIIAGLLKLAGVF